MSAAQYIADFFHAAKNKVTTYLAITTASVAEIPNVVTPDQLEAIHKVVSDNTHKHIVAGLAVVTIWTHVRRSIGTQPKP